jgi:DNA-binding response OmpR family regulator
MSAGRVLIADADRSQLSLLALHLRNEDYTVITASEGVEALNQIERDPPDLMVLDLGLADEDGATVYDQLGERVDLLRMPILYLVGPRLLRHGAPQLPKPVMIHKPVVVGELLEKMRMSLAGTIDQLAESKSVEADDETDLVDAARE